MKRVILMCLLCASLTNYAQEWTRKINDPDWHDRRSKGLRIGDRMPDLPLGNVHNNKTGKTRLSDFKGKLVILDFWQSYCGPCIKGFPKMQKLQQEFGDKIQILLVNTTETIEEANRQNRNLKLPDLPCIMKDASISKELEKLFPSSTLGHQVWIDQQGKIKLRGSSLNNTSEKIREFLAGKEVFTLNDNSVVPQFRPDYPYVKLLGDFKNPQISYSSVFTPFNNEYEAGGSGKVEGLIDTASKTIRNTYINLSPLKLFLNAYLTELKAGEKEILYFHNQKSDGYLPYVVMPKDTLRYSDYLSSESLDVDNYVKSRFCYEQIVPLSLSEDQRRAYLQQDLNRYFGSRYGTEAKIERRMVPCYILIRTSKMDKISSMAKQDYAKVDTLIRNKMKVIKYGKFTLGALNDIIRANPALSSFFIQNAKKNEAALLLNETGFKLDKSIDLILPDSKDLTTIEDFRKALVPFDLDIQLVKRDIQFLVINDNSGT